MWRSLSEEGGRKAAFFLCPSVPPSCLRASCEEHVEDDDQQDQYEYASTDIHSHIPPLTLSLGGEASTIRDNYAPKHCIYVVVETRACLAEIRQSAYSYRNAKGG